MLRRSLIRRVHLFSALVPNVVVQGPTFLTSDELNAATVALAERSSFLTSPKLAKSFEALHDISTAPAQQQTTKALSECVDDLRAQLYRKDCIDPRQRLELHEAIMAAGFYQRVLSPTQLKGEGVRFVLNHYNFDIRRDTQITKKVHEALLEEQETTTTSEELLRDLLLLERRLMGEARFCPTSGRRWFTLGLALSDIKTEAEVHRVLDLPVVKSVGNFTFGEIDSEKLWKTITMAPKAEAQMTFAEAAGIHKDVKETDKLFQLRVQKPVAPLEFWERVRETLLRYWVIWFTVWVTFFMVDEEIITLVALIFLKHKQTKILEEEAEKSGGKVYIASALGRSRD